MGTGGQYEAIVGGVLTPTSPCKQAMRGVLGTSGYTKWLHKS